MAGGKWQSADKIIAEVRMQEDEEMARYESGTGTCWCGRPERHRGRHRGSPGGSANLTGPDDPRRITTVPQIKIDESPSVEVEEFIDGKYDPVPEGPGITEPVTVVPEPEYATPDELRMRYLEILLTKAEADAVPESLYDRIERLLGMEEDAT